MRANEEAKDRVFIEAARECVRVEHLDLEGEHKSSLYITSLAYRCDAARARERGGAMSP